MINNTQHTPTKQLFIYPGFEYRSELEVLGWPLVHVTKGYDPLTGKQRVSKGVIAIGESAIGLVAIGGFALGVIAIGGMGIGLIAFGGLAAGLIAFGGVALGMFVAMGAAAFSLMYAIGVMANAEYVISPFRMDWEVIDHLRQLW